MVIFAASFFYLYIFSKTYPLPILNRVSLDAKFKFIRDHIDTNTVDTIIIGSSIGLENISGARLEVSSKRCQSVLNLSGSGLRAVEIEQLLELLPTFPNLKRIIYSAQFSDFSGSATLKDFQSTLIIKYISNTLTFKDKVTLMSLTFQNIYSCIKRQWEWNDKHMSKNKFGYLGFDHTGSVPIHIYGNDIIKNRWEIPHSAKQDDKSYLTLDRISKTMKYSRIKFYFVMQPYRIPLVKQFEHVRSTMQYFENNVKQIVLKNEGKFLNLHDKLHLSDHYFSDRSHLNIKGAEITAKAIAAFIDKEE